ncbi:putative holin-like toxin [Granulicatella sp. WM01]|nr:putative holin-like toxin [Granulicatella sp. WM01]
MGAFEVIQTILGFSEVTILLISLCHTLFKKGNKK